MKGLAATDERHLHEIEAYVLTGGMEGKPLISYLLEREQARFSEVLHSLFYFGERGLDWHIRNLFRLEAVDVGFEEDRAITAAENFIEFEGKKYKMLEMVGGAIEREIENYEGGHEGKLKRTHEAADYLHKNFSTFLEIRRKGNSMPYDAFLELDRGMKWSERVRLKHYDVLDFGYEGEIPTVYLNKKITNAIDALMG